MKPSLHNRCYFFAFSRRAKASAKRAGSARHGARQGKPTWDKTATVFFLKKSYAKVMRNIVFMCVLQLEIHFSRVNETHSVGVWSFRLRINLLHLWTVKAKWITLKLRPGWIVTKRLLTFVLFCRETANRRRAAGPRTDGQSAVCVILWRKLTVKWTTSGKHASSCDK